MGESAVKRPHTPNPKLELALSEQPENEHEDKYRRDNATTKFVSRGTSQTPSQQVIHNNPPLVR